MKVIATYLVFHWEKATFLDMENKISQSYEDCEIPQDKMKVDDMKEVFSAFLNQKYGEGKWKFEYWMGYKNGLQTLMTLNAPIQK